jgi:hypothetical protein
MGTNKVKIYLKNILTLSNLKLKVCDVCDARVPAFAHPAIYLTGRKKMRFHFILLSYKAQIGKALESPILNEREFL